MYVTIKFPQRAFDDSGCEGGGTEHFEYHIYVCLNSFYNASTENGKKLIETLRDFDREAGYKINIRFPYEGREDAFRQKICAQAPAAAREHVSGDSIGILVLKTSIDQKSRVPDERYLYFSLDSILDDYDRMKTKNLKDYLRVLAVAINRRTDIFEAMREKARQDNAKNLFDALDLKPGYFGASIDIKHIIKLFRGS